MDRETLKKNPIFKSIIASLKRRYPFIIGYRIPEDFEEDVIEYPTLMFINLVISLDKLSEYLGNKELDDWVNDYFKYNNEFVSTGLWVPFDVDVDNKEEFEDLQSDIETDIPKIQNDNTPLFNQEDRLSKSLRAISYIFKK